MSSFSSGMYVNTNLNALGTNRHLGLNNSSLSKSLERLSSGYKINVASDDPSGLQISEQLRSQQSGIARAIQNSQEASNVISIAEGALIEINSILTKMRQLAIHAANEGATSPEQIAADQAEIDSGIQTIDRIASTTKYSDQFLLNGSKSLIYNTATTVNDSMDNALVDITNSRMDQVLQRGNASGLTINFTGLNADTNNAAIGDRQARRAVLECDKTLAGENKSNGWVPEIKDGYITETQKFILTGNNGSRSFSFMDGTHLGTIAEAINGLKTSTGIGATLTFDSSVSGSQVEIENFGTDGTFAGKRVHNDAAIYNLDSDNAGVASISSDTTGTNYNEYALVTGKNLDADGRMYLQWQSETEYIAYKDEAMTMEVGRGGNGSVMTSSNNSGVSSAYLTIKTTAGIEKGDVTVLQFGQQFEAYKETSPYYQQNGINSVDMQPLEADFGLDMTSGASCFSGIRLQDNTSDDAKLYFRTSYDETTQETTVSIYKDAQMLPESMVATGSAKADTAPYQVSCKAVDATNSGTNSGLYTTLSFEKAIAAGTDSFTAQGTLEFNNLGLRVYSEDYGSDQYIRLQNLQGNLLGSYPTTDSDQLTGVRIGETIQANGGDALISINGQMVRTQGLSASISSQNYSGELNFNRGSAGMSTIAQVGQEIGALSTRGGALQAVAETDPNIAIDDPKSKGYLSWTTNARHNTSEDLSNFIGGMQYQLGEGESDIERTIYSIPSMAAANVGKVTYRDTVYTLQDVLSGGTACLANDPVAAMKIISVAIDDVTATRARLGAFQKDMLDTNINSLDVTVENIAKTESYIRDTDMATESTEYTKNQVLVQAGTSMLAQANNLPQNVLSLLG